jgi:tRNA splicing ligase
MLRLPTWARFNRSFSSTKLINIKPLITRFIKDSTAMSEPSSSMQEDSDLVASLHALSAKSPKLVRSSVYSAPSDSSIQIRSWKMNEFKYYDVPSPFPTLARGLFTREMPGEQEDEKRYQIVVRGYDKFFNIGEVPWTTVCFDWLSSSF